MKNTLFNNDHFNTWNICRKKYCYKYIKELKFPQFHQDYELGKSVHALIDYNLRGFNTDFLLQNAGEDILELWNSIKTHPIMSKKVIKTEWGFNSKISNTPYWLIGRVDAIFYDEANNKYIIADWKTGKVIPSKINSNFQHKVYLYALYQSRKDLGLDFKPEDISFQYFKIYPDYVDDSEKIDYSEEKFVEYGQDFSNIINNIKDSAEFASHGICNDKYCEYKNLCLR